MTTDLTEDVSTEMEYDSENWTTSDLGIIMLMVAVAVFILYNFFSSIGWMQFTERSIMIVPAIIGSMLQSNTYLKRTALKIIAATSLIVKIMAMNNITITDSIVNTAALRIIDLTVLRTYLSIVAAINFVVKKPLFVVPIVNGLTSVLNVPSKSRVAVATALTFIILVASSIHYNFARRFIRLAVLVIFGFTAILWVLIGIYSKTYDVIFITTSGISAFYCGFLLRCSHELVNIAVALSIAIFTHDLLSSFIEIPNYVYLILYGLFMHFSVFVMLVYEYMRYSFA